MEAHQYDPTSRLWYNGAKTLKGGFWSDLYSFNSAPYQIIPGITASFPIYDDKNKLLGVWGVDIVLEELSAFLSDIGASRSADLVIFNDQEKVIAYSGFKDVAIKDKLLSLTDLNNSKMEKAITSYRKHGFSDFYFEEEGIRYLASYSSFVFGEEQGWSLLLVVRERQLIEHMAMNLTLVMVFALIVLITALSALTCGLWLSVGAVWVRWSGSADHAAVLAPAWLVCLLGVQRHLLLHLWHKQNLILILILLKAASQTLLLHP